MKRGCLIVLFYCALLNGASGQSWIRINQLGYLPESVKVAVFISESANDISSFRVCDAITDRI
ncbi:MAG TPA: cellulase N-terminal Ig-like domain-containing protein, partial [Bacteroidales bacterium]|nr:cellulase N-terminal Ig-like domain-containing protein [Bacteroidales bacterium]